MKKLKTILFSLCALFIAVSLTGCKNTANNENGGSNFKGNFVIQGVGPEISMEPTVEEGTLVLRGYFEDHTDHIFLKAGKWENFFESENEYLPGTKVKFEGYVVPLDAAAGNHYYDVVNVESLSFKDYPNEDEVKEILDSYNYCDQDSDCTNFVGHCPFGCFIAVNKNFSGIATNIMNNYFDVNGTYCAYGCMYIDTVKCENFKCHAIAKDVPEGAVFCTIEQKKTETCNMQYDPVCGDDLHTYGNSCTACSSQNIDYYTPGECSTQLIDGDKNSLLDKIYKTAAFKDIRELGEDYDMKQALSDDVIILSAEKNNLAQFFKTTESRWNTKDERLIIYRLAQTTVEGDLVLYDIYFDKNDNLIYLITDFTRDKFSAPEDRVINIRQFENIGIYEHNGIKYGVLYNGEINDEVFQSEDCFVLANLEDLQKNNSINNNLQEVLDLLKQNNQVSCYFSYNNQEKKLRTELLLDQSQNKLIGLFDVDDTSNTYYNKLFRDDKLYYRENINGQISYGTVKDASLDIKNEIIEFFNERQDYRDWTQECFGDDHNFESDTFSIPIDVNFEK